MSLRTDEKIETIKNFVRNILKIHEMVINSGLIENKDATPYVKITGMDVDETGKGIANRIVEYALELKAEGYPDNEIPDEVIKTIMPQLNADKSNQSVMTMNM